jgi:hypothetical protein
MKSMIRGVVRGKIIELPEETGLPEGQEVSVTLEPIVRSEAAIEGLRRSAGGWADEAEELDKYLEWNRQQRKASRRPIAP